MKQNQEIRSKKVKKQLYAIKKIKNLDDSRQKIINLLNDNVKIRSEAIYKAKQNKIKGTGLKILRFTQIFQRLPIALVQVKAGNNSESLLKRNQANCLFFVSIKTNHQKIYNNIIKSI